MPADADCHEALRGASLPRRVIASYLGTTWSALLSLAFVPLYVRYLGIEAYGLIGFFAMLQVWLSVLDMGLSSTLSRELALFAGGSRQLQSVRDLLRSMEVIFAGTACMVALLIAGLSPFIAEYWLNASMLASQTIANSIVLMGFVIAIQWMGTLYRSGLLGLQLQVWLSTATAISATVRAVGSVVVLAWSPTIIAFLVFQGVVSAVETLVIGRRLQRRLPRPPFASRFSTNALKQVWRFAGGVSVISLLATLLTQLDKLLLSKLLPLDQFGYFMLMATVAGALSVFVVPLHNVAYPRLAEVVATGDQKALVNEYHKFAQFLSIGMLPAALMLIVFSNEIIFLWTGDAAITRAVAPLLSVWVSGTALNSLTHVPHMAQMAHGWTKLGIVMSTLMVATSTTLLILLVPRYGAMAAAWIWVAVNAAYLLFAIPAMHSQILRGEKWNWYVRDVLVPLAAGAAAVAAFKAVLAESRAIPVAYLMFGALFIFLAVGAATNLGRQAFTSLARQVFRK